jgi:tetratricopeptide (TPR) repeat protein
MTDKAVKKKKPKWAVLAVCFFLALLVWGIFGQTLRYDFVNYDDPAYVYDNPHISSGITLEGLRWVLTHSHGSNWHPLTSLSHMLDCQLYGLNPAGHHLTNVLLHMITVMLLFLVLRQMTGSLWRSAFVAAVFAIHPLRVESVAWISERKDVLSGLFFMLTLGAYLRYVRRPFSVGRYAVMAGCFILGLMSKPMLVTLPAVLLLLDYWPLRRFQSVKIKKLLLEKAPLFLLVAVFCVITFYAQTEARMPENAISLPLRLANAAVSFVTYIGQLFYPAGLAVFYPHPLNTLPAWKIGASLLFLAGSSLAVFAGRKKLPYLPAGWLWYLGMMIPVSGLVQVGSQAHADRYTYLPHIGLIILITWAASDLCSRRRHRRVLLSVLAAAVLGGLVPVAYIQTSYWKDSISLWRHALACTDRNYAAHNNLGVMLSDQIKLDRTLRRGKRTIKITPDDAQTAEAIRHFEQALEILPNYVQAHNNIGLLLNRQGKTEDALRHFEKALETEPDSAVAHGNIGAVLSSLGETNKAISHFEKALKTDPDLVHIHNDLGALLSDQGKVHEAIRHLEKALQINRDYAEAHNNIGLIFSRQGNADAAFRHFEKALQIDPDYAEAHNNVGLLFSRQKKPGEALLHFRKALQIKPDYAEAHNNVGTLLGSQGKTQEAFPHFEKALEINPDHAEAHNNLGLILNGWGKAEEAFRHFEKALEINPDYAQARNHIGLLLSRQGKIDEAIRHFEKALEISPDYAEAHNHIGIAFYGQGKVDEALQHFEEALKIYPAYAEVHNNMGILFNAQGKIDEAIRHFEKALKFYPDYTEAKISLAGILATSPDAGLRDGKRAVELARSVDQISGGTNASVLDVLAAAYAEAGQYPEAVETARRALAASAPGGFSDSIRERLKLYQASMPYHEK